MNRTTSKTSRRDEDIYELYTAGEGARERRDIFFCENQSFDHVVSKSFYIIHCRDAAERGKKKIRTAA